MASSDRNTRLVAIRDNLEAELADETARRAALALAGHPPPTSYSAGGKSLSWNEYMSMMLKAIADLNELINATGADGGFPESSIVAFPG